jgi:hypothetical protein
MTALASAPQSKLTMMNSSPQRQQKLRSEALRALLLGGGNMDKKTGTPVSISSNNSLLAKNKCYNEHVEPSFAPGDVGSMMRRSDSKNAMRAAPVLSASKSTSFLDAAPILDTSSSSRNTLLMAVDNNNARNNDTSRRIKSNSIRNLLLSEKSQKKQQQERVESTGFLRESSSKQLLKSCLSSSSLRRSKGSTFSMNSLNSQGSCVSFSDKVKVRRIPSRDHMSRRQRESSYFSKEELRNIQSQARDIVHEVSTGNAQFVSSEDLEGLEKHLPHEQSARQARRQQAIQAVLRQQQLRPSTSTYF